MRILVSVLAVCLGGLATCARSQTAPSPAPAASAATSADLASGEFWRVMASPYTYHYSHDPQHRPVHMLGLERQFANGNVWGGSAFTNSFGQPSAYLYGGQRLENFSAYKPFFAQWTAGLLYGYKGSFADKVPLNHNGFSPGLVLSLGWQFTPAYSVQANVLGNSALMFQFTLDLR